MKRRTFALAFAGILIATSGITLAANEAISIRQMQMKHAGRAFKSISAIAKGSVAYDPAAIQGTLEALAKDARDFPNNFPAGSDKGDTDALPAVWTNFDDFKNRSLALADHADAAAKATDLAAFKATAVEIAKDCKSCHDNYRR